MIENSTELDKPVLWPTKLADPSIVDMGYPLELLLINLGINPKPEDMDSTGFAAEGNEVPASVAIIEAGATEFSKSAAKVIKLGGGVTAIAGAAAGFWANVGDGVRAATIGGAGLVLAAAVISLAVIVASDVRARGGAAAAQYHARATIAAAYLAGAVALNGETSTAPVSAPGTAAPATAAAPCVDAKTLGLLLGAVNEGGLKVHLKNGDDHTAHRVRFHEATGELEVRCGPSDWRAVSEIESFDPPS